MIPKEMLSKQVNSLNSLQLETLLKILQQAPKIEFDALSILQEIQRNQMKLADTHIYKKHHRDANFQM